MDTILVTLVRGMRHYCFRKNAYVCPKINVDKLWSLLGQAKYDKYKDGKSAKAPVIDCTANGFFKVLGSGHMPTVPVIVKARFFSRRAELKINAAGGVCVLAA